MIESYHSNHYSCCQSSYSKIPETAEVQLRPPAAGGLHDPLANIPPWKLLPRLERKDTIQNAAPMIGLILATFLTSCKIHSQFPHTQVVGTHANMVDMSSTELNSPKSPSVPCLRRSHTFEHIWTFYTLTHIWEKYGPSTCHLWQTSSLLTSSAAFAAQALDWKRTWKVWVPVAMLENQWLRPFLLPWWSGTSCSPTSVFGNLTLWFSLAPLERVSKKVPCVKVIGCLKIIANLSFILELRGSVY